LSLYFFYLFSKYKNHQTNNVIQLSWNCDEWPEKAETSYSVNQSFRLWECETWSNSHGLFFWFCSFSFIL